MVQIGELATLITANTQPFERATKRASGATRSFAGDVDRTSQTLGGKFSSSLKKAGSLLAGPLGITASFAGVAAASKQAFSALKQEAEALDAIGKLSSRTGISTEDLTALEFIAGQTGASFDQVQRAVEAFQKRLGQAKMGTGEAAKVLEELNIDVDTFTRLPLVEQLMQISDRLAGMTTQADKAAVAAALFS